MQRVNRKVESAVRWLELILAAFVIAGVVIGAFELIIYIKNIFFAHPPGVYDTFKGLLGYVLLLVIGLELSIMLIRHTPGSVIEVMLFAIAWKILIYTTETYEFLIGVVALAGLFAIRRFIFVPKIAETNGIVLSAATSVKDVNRIVGCHIPENMANTLGGVMTSLAGGRHQNIGIGNRLSIADVELQVISSIDGLIEKVRIDKLEAGAK